MNLMNLNLILIFIYIIYFISEPQIILSRNIGSKCASRILWTFSRDPEGNHFLAHTKNLFSVFCFK